MSKPNPIEGEPSFVLLARDPQAPDLIEKWASDRERMEPDATTKIGNARTLAFLMRHWKRQHPTVGASAKAYAALATLTASKGGEHG